MTRCIRFLYSAGALLVALLLAASTAQAGLTGIWAFDDANNPALATVGTNLTFEAVAPTHSASLADDGSVSLSGVITTAAADNANRIRADHGVAPNGGGGLGNQYTIVTDIFSPTGSRSSWRTIYQTNTSNSTDAGYFISNNDDHLGVSAIGYSANPILRITSCPSFISHEL